MHTIGIVAEYNPFHSGHAYQLRQSKQLLGGDGAVVAVMSGNWVQQADCAIADKWIRARLALLGGVDLVLELPTVWAAASAETFAFGAVSLLDSAGVVEHLSFGSELGQVAPLRQVAEALEAPDISQVLSPFLRRGLPFAAARQAALEETLGPAAAALSAPNNTLGIEYLRALSRLHSTIQPLTVRRAGAAHNSLAEETEHRSATQIRRSLRAGEGQRAAAYLHPDAPALLLEAGLPSLDLVSRAVLARLRTMTARDWAALPDSGAAEGLPQRLERAGRECSSPEDFLTRCKTKRYAHARLRRLLLWAYLGLTEADRPAAPPYLRVLGFNARGQELLRQMKDRAALPILTKPAHARDLDEPGRRLFQLEARCTDLYDLCRRSIPAPGREWTTGPVVLR